MLHSLNRLWALLVLVMSTQAMALGLGEIRLDSALNEPLRAEIVLLSATAEELENLTVRMASADAFARYGLDRPAFLQSVQFRIIPSGRRDGNIVRLVSSEPITEPFLTFLVEASWTRGRLLREYTVLLDPPTFAPPPTEQITQAVQPPVRSQPADSGQITRPAPQPQPQPVPEPAAPAPRPVMPQSTAAEPAPAPSPQAEQPAPQPRQQAPDTTGFDSTSTVAYRVQSGDTLWGIASRYRADDSLTINQMMLAIYEANPQAFDNNINRLSAGANLQIPSANDVFRIDRADALAEVQRQHSAWQGGSVSASAGDATPSLELVPPDEDALADDTPATYEGPDLADDATAAPSGSLDDIRIAEIEDLLADEQDGLVVIEDNELAALRRELAELRGEPLPEAPVADTAADAADDEAAVDPADSPDDEVFVDEAETAAADDAATEEEAEPAPVARPAPTPVAEESIVDKIFGAATGIWGLVGLAVVLVLAALVFFARRAVRGSGDEEGTGLWEAVDDDDRREHTQQIPSIGRDDDTFVVEESVGGGTINEPPEMTSTMEIPADMPPAADYRPAESTALHVARPDSAEAAMADTFSSDTALNLDQSDPIAEADFHMAYGLYDQAADLVTGALAVEPQRSDLLAKLCEIYFVWGNRDAFVDAAQRFKELLGDGEDPEWDKTVIMGQQIAGDIEMFSDTPAGATRAVDLAFGDDGDGAALDMDFASGDDDGVIDLGSDEDAVDRIGGRSNTALDFEFDADEPEGTVETAEVPAAEEDPFAAAFDDDDADIKTREMQTADFTGIDELAPDHAATGDDEGPEAAAFDDSTPDATAEIDLDDLGLDLGGLGDDLDSTAEGEALDLDLTVRTPGSDAEASDNDETSLLEATGHTQILPDGFAVDTGAGDNIEKALSEDEDSSQAVDAADTLSSSDDSEADAGGAEFADTEVMSGGLSEDETSVLASRDLDLDLDLDELTAALEVGDDSDAVNQLGENATAELRRPAANGDDSPTAMIAPEDLADDLHDARTMTEVGTKLDLARAYVDMGDPRGARSILEEVLDEGDDSQRQQAQHLLDTLPA